MPHNPSLTYQTFSPPSAAIPLFLVHGFPLDSRIFDDIAPLLAQHRQVFSVDLAGFGQTPYPHPFALDDQARFLHALISAQAPNGAILAGLSMGGYVALAYHRLYADTLAALILIDTKASADNAEAKTNRDRMAEIARHKGASAVADMMQPKMLSDHTRQTNPQVETHLMEIMRSCPPATIAHACIAMRDRPDYTPDLPNMTIPLLMVTGQDDAIAPPAIGQAIAAAAALGTYAEIPHAGHLSTMEQPTATADAINDFLTAHNL